MKIFFPIIILIVLSCNTEKRSIDETACYKTNSKILVERSVIPGLTITNGDNLVFDYTKIRNAVKRVADTDFYERLIFEVNTKEDKFYFTNYNIQNLLAVYEFHGGEAPLANTDFIIRKGFIKGEKSKNGWLVEVEAGVVDKQKTDSLIQTIKFKTHFKLCN